MMKEGIDYTRSENGLIIFTAAYLLSRDYCCGNGCLNCPYNYIHVPEPQRSRLIKKRADGKKENSTDNG